MARCGGHIADMRVGTIYLPRTKPLILAQSLDVEVIGREGTSYVQVRAEQTLLVR